MSYIVQTDEVALAAQAKYREDAIKAGKERALALGGIATPGAPNPEHPYNGRYDNLVERCFDYGTDFLVPTAGAAAIAGGVSGWVTMPLVAVGLNYSVFATVPVPFVPVAVVPVVPNNQVWVFYKVSILATGALVDPVSYLFFFTGQSQNRKDQFDLEPLYGKLNADGFFSKPVVYDKNDFCGASVRARVVSAVGIRVCLQGWVIEPGQNTFV